MHKARLADGREVAVKVQYVGLETAVNADFTTLSLLAQAAARFFPGSFDFGCAPESSLRSCACTLGVHLRTLSEAVASPPVRSCVEPRHPKLSIITDIATLSSTK